MPELKHSSSNFRFGFITSSTSHFSTLVGITEINSIKFLASTERRDILVRIESLIVAGTPSSLLLNNSFIKKGLPPVISNKFFISYVSARSLTVFSVKGGNHPDPDPEAADIRSGLDQGRPGYSGLV